ncbi:MAG: beta-ketoacyl-ACP synthase II [Deinococcus-Thermus bacterium]|jgi:3-oxoacyl-[acyl-carrier-protein] synthase II|nr:beta-ketoacyl-ACP synthase II [Deinococcota bacterium]
MKRVVVTGVGPVTPIGVGADAFLEGQQRGDNGIRTITSFDASDLSVRIAGEVDVDISAYIERKRAKRLDRFVHLALIGSELALRDAGLADEDVAGERTGTSIGSGIGGLGTWERESRVRFERDPMRVSPFFIPMLIANMASGHVAMRYGLTGPSTSVVTACSTGSGSIGDAYRIVQRGEADLMLAGGSEAPITPMGIAGFAVMKALSTRNDDPATASRPFSRDRDGFVAGEGAGVLVLEELEHAKARGARIYAEITGYATSADAYHITAPAPGGTGAARCLRWALDDARIDADEAGYLNAHGTSTPANDLNETLAITSVFGGPEQAPPVSSTKSMTGHTLGAAGGIEAIATVQAIASGVLPPTRNLHDPDPELQLDYVPNEAREARLDVAISQNFAFGGQNAALVFKRFA